MSISRCYLNEILRWDSQMPEELRALIFSIPVNSLNQRLFIFKTENFQMYKTDKQRNGQKSEIANNKKERKFILMSRASYTKVMKANRFCRLSSPLDKRILFQVLTRDCYKKE
ncbi:CLUMA_CG019210, isoform A [Clunio marinus]|uniref:CLUMA_CG019210, isoform A n=1 Tax=Clunio marinus TaxID=568069 RepID=A0A1J1J0U4_9DIPT|nr:CLUMA_CG019210, isoform A [Clunio marinus]